MKRFFLYIVLFFPLAALAQDLQQFTIKGKIGNLNAPVRAYLIYQLGANQVIDSAAFSNGNFNFKGQIINPVNAFIVIDRAGVGLSRLDNSADFLSFYIDKGDLELSSADSVAKAKFKGSKINDDNNRLMAQLNPIMDEAKELKIEVDTTSPATQRSPAFQTMVQTRQKQLQTKQKAVLKLFILANPDSYLSLIALSAVGGPAPDPVELETLYSALAPSLKETETAKIFKRNLDVLKKTSVGVLAPDFTQNDVNGVPVTLSKFRGKYVFIDFWASWCGPCRQENPNVVRAFNKFKDKNFTIIGVSLDKANAKENWLGAIKDDGLNWTQVSDLKFWQNQVAILYDIKSIPANFLLDPTGKIIARDLRGTDLENKLAEVFANP